MSCSLNSLLSSLQVSDPHITSLLESVESGYGRQVAVVHANLPRNAYAFSFVHSNGTPVIEIPPTAQLLSRGHAHVATTLIHELFHLRRRAEKFPVCRLRRILSCSATTHISRSQLITLGLEASNLLEHYVFFREMRDWGMHPEAETQQSVNQIAYGGVRPGVSRFPREVEAAMAVLQTLIEIPNPTIANDLCIAMQRYGFSQSADAARSAYESISKITPTTPYNQALLCKRIIDVVLKVDSSLVFEASSWGQIRYCVVKAVIREQTHTSRCLQYRCAWKFRSIGSVLPF